MPAPITLGQLRVNIRDMEIGDYIMFKWNNALNIYEVMSDPADGTEVPVNGVRYGTVFDKMFIYMIKVDYGLLISDRCTHNTVSFNTLNNAKAWCRKMTVSGVEGFFRTIYGGVAYANSDGSKYLDGDLGYGAYPIFNEWDKYIVRSNCNGKIVAGSNDVWHWDEGVASWTLDYPTLNMKNSAGTSAAGSSNQRIIRGKMATDPTNPTVRYVGVATSSVADANIGFRPVFEYKEV